MAVTATLLASACATLVDEGHARECRSLVAAIEAPDAKITILRTAAGEPQNSVRVDYRLDGSEISQLRHVVCRFGAENAELGRDTLIGVDTAQGPLGEAQLLFLRRFYLDAPGEPPPDPGASGTVSLLTLPTSFALALQQLVAALPSAAIYGLLASSYALIHGLVGRVVFGFGDLAALGGYATLTGLALGAVAGSPLALIAGFVLALGVSASYGIAAGRFAVLPALRAKGQAVVIATVGMMIALAEYSRLTVPRSLIWAPPLLSSPIALVRAQTFVVTVTPMQMLSAAIGLFGALCLLAYQRWSTFGREWRAVSQDEIAAAMLGIDRDRVFTHSFAIAAALAGLSGYVLTVHFGQTGYAYGFTLGLKALVGAVLGGIGSIGAAFAGGVILAFSEAAWSALFSVDSRDLAVYSLLAILFIFRPYGIFGRRPDSPSLN
ncbi:MAG: branched-chain amino acid ABC transporter permease [Hyphomicrobiales bacterium]|nr:branched-chain amino acid ABC transporter permease [Hyphomicrobiales bacterium]MBV9051973.1 branched-chain amino acid ABC transporter permease [Hyphomicrobiales bacterium]